MIDGAFKFSFVQLVERAATKAASDFLEVLVTTVLYEGHTVLTDNCIQLADIQKNRYAASGQRSQKESS
ncbi:hypothetical protein [Brucella gallinifaecis]|uniref:hypothetical protein n=1 Tax=Brucella gallinifaecis TaxID=215590 RepID=UPI0030816EC0